MFLVKVLRDTLTRGRYSSISYPDSCVSQNKLQMGRIANRKFRRKERGQATDSFSCQSTSVETSLFKRALIFLAFISNCTYIKVTSNGKRKTLK